MNKIFKRNKCRYEDSSVGKRSYFRKVGRFTESLGIAIDIANDDYVSSISESVWERVETIKRKADLVRES